MCLGSIFSMALAVILSIVSSFFSHASRLPPPSNPKQLNLYCLDTVQVCSPSPVPSYCRLFGYSGLSLYRQSPFRFSQQRGAQLLLHPKLFEDESRNSGNTGSPWQRKCPLHGSLLTGLFQERPVVLISEGRVLCKPSSHRSSCLLCQQKSQVLNPHCLVCEIR